VLIIPSHGVSNWSIIYIINIAPSITNLVVCSLSNKLQHNSIEDPTKMLASGT
jgi:hypothetical protein